MKYDESHNDLVISAETESSAAVIILMLRNVNRFGKLILIRGRKAVFLNERYKRKERTRARDRERERGEKKTRYSQKCTCRRARWRLSVFETRLGDSP